MATRHTIAVNDDLQPFAMRRLGPLNAASRASGTEQVWSVALADTLTVPPNLRWPASVHGRAALTTAGSSLLVWPAALDFHLEPESVGDLAAIEDDDPYLAPSCIDCSGSVQCVAAVPGATKCVIGTTSGRLELLDWGQTLVPRPLPPFVSAVTWDLGHVSTVGSVAVSANGQHAVAGLYNSQVVLFDLSRPGNILHTLTGHTADVRGVCITAAGDVAFSCGLDGSVRQWDTETGQAVCITEPVRKTGGWLYTVQVSADGTVAATAGLDGEVRVWDVVSGETIVVWEHDRWLHGCALSADGRLLVSTGSDGVVRVLDIAQRECLQVLEHSGHSALATALSADCSSVVVGTVKGPLWGAVVGGVPMTKAARVR